MDRLPFRHDESDWFKACSIDVKELSKEGMAEFLQTANLPQRLRLLSVILSNVLLEDKLLLKLTPLGLAFAVIIRGLVERRIEENSVFKRSEFVEVIEDALVPMVEGNNEVVNKILASVISELALLIEHKEMEIVQ